MTTNSSSPFSLAGKIALITGGGTGLGLGMARCLVAAGARAVLVGRRKNVLEEAIDKLGKQACYRVHDILRYEQNPILLNEIESSIGPLDILVNNAGIHLKKAAMDAT